MWTKVVRGRFLERQMGTLYAVVRHLNQISQEHISLFTKVFLVCMCLCVCV